MIPASGAVDFGQIQTEFGGSNPISLNEYYSGSVGVLGGAVPASGAISVDNLRGTNAYKGYGFSSFSTPVVCKAFSLNFNTEAVAYCSTATVGSPSSVNTHVNSATKAYQMAQQGSSTFAITFLTEVSELITSTVTAGSTNGGTTACTNSSTAGYQYLGQANANAIPSLPTLRTNISKLTFSNQTYSTASGSTPTCTFTSYHSCQSSTKGYTAGSDTWTGDLYNPVDNFSGALRVMTFSAESVATSGNSLTGPAGLSSGGNSSTTGYFLGRAGAPVAYATFTVYNLTNSVNFSNDTCADVNCAVSNTNGNMGITNSRSKIYYYASGTTYAYNFTNNTNSSISTGTAAPQQYAAQSYTINP
jgi:hypothetical protein